MRDRDRSRNRLGGTAAGLTFGLLLGFFFGAVGWGVNQPGFVRALVVVAAVGTVTGAVFGFGPDGAGDDR